MKKVKKVLFSATVDSHILQFHLPYLKWFKEQGYEVHVATNGTQNIPYCDVKHVVPFERNPIKINNLKSIKILKDIIKKEKFDIIHCHTPMGGVVTRLAAKKYRKEGTKVIYTAHGFHFYKGAPIKNWLIYYPVEWYLAKYTDCIITINTEDYNLAKGKFKKCKKIEYVPGVGIDVERFSNRINNEKKKEKRNSLGLDGNDFIMIFPARLDVNKNQIFLIEVMEKLTKVHNNIYLLLPGVDELNGYYRKIIEQKHLEKNVKLMGYRDDIPELMKISNLSVSSSLREGLPINIIEAIACGLPVVTLNCRGISDLIVNGKNGYLVNQNSIDEFCEYVEKVYNNQNDINKILKLENYESIKKYSISSVIENLKNIYESKNNGIIFTRSTEIFNDSRASKEIKTYSEIYKKTIVLGWNRNNLDNKIIKNNLPENCDIYLYNRKASYGTGIKNILNIIRFNFWLYKNLKLKINDFEIIHACDFDTAFIARRIAKKYKKKLIYDIYDYYCDCHNLGILKKFVELADISLINSADNIILCTEQRKEQIIKAKPKKITVIHNTPEIKLTEKKEKQNNNIFKLCYVGILQDDRLLKEIANEIEKYDNYELHIGGFGKYEDYFKKISNKSKNIKFYGQLNYSDTLKLEAESDILFATYNPKIKNHKYSAPNKFYEAIALGKPIIVCKNTGIDQIVSDEKIGYVIDYNVEDFFDVLGKIDNENYNTISQKGQMLYSTKYNWSIMKQKLINISYELINYGEHQT